MYSTRVLLKYFDCPFFEQDVHIHVLTGVIGEINFNVHHFLKTTHILCSQPFFGVISNKSFRKRS